MSRLLSPGWRRRIGFGLFVGQLLTIFGLALSYGLLVLSALWTVWSYRRTFWHRLSAIGSGALLLPMTVYSVLFIASAIGSYDPAVSLGKLGDLGTLLPLPLALLWVRGERRTRLVVSGLVVLGTVFALCGLAELLLNGVDLKNRIQFPFSHYQTYAGVLLLCDLLVVARLVYPPSEGRRLLDWAALVLISAALVFSLTRGAWVALALAAALLLTVRVPRVLLPAAAVLLVAGLVVPLPVLARVASITDLRDISNYDRICMSYSGAQMIADRPLLGVGPSMVKHLYPIYRHPTAPNLLRPHLHNAFLQVAAEQGLPGLAAFVWMLATSAACAFRFYHDEGGSRGSRADLYVAVLLGLCAFAIAGLFEDNWSDTEVQRVLLFVLAVPFCARVGVVEGREDSP